MFDKLRNFKDMKKLLITYLLEIVEMYIKSYVRILSTVLFQGVIEGLKFYNIWQKKFAFWDFSSTSTI